MGLFLAISGLAVGLAAGASDAAQEASIEAAKVAADLSIHEARQNGSLESIQSKLSHLEAGQVKHDKSLDELLRRLYSEHPSPP
jgi:hypothetical protein